MIELIELDKRFEDKEVIKDLNLRVEQGEFVSLLGPSGCGKSTTLKLITGILEPDAGDIKLDQQSLLNQPIESRETLLVFQDYVLFPHMTVEKNIEFGLKMRKMKKQQRKERVKEMLELVNLEGYEKTYPNELSGGQRQRVAIARALAVDPKVLLLDEPFSSLDRQLRIETRDFIKDLQMKMGITTLLVTHDQEEAWVVSDRVAIMLDGQVEQYNTPEKIYKAPANEAVAKFLGNRNIFACEVKDGLAISLLGTFPCKADQGQKQFLIRKENVMVKRLDAIDEKLLDEKKEARNQPLKGKVKKRSFGGQNIYYQIECEGTLIEAIGEEHFVRGEEVFLQFKPETFHYMPS